MQLADSNIMNAKSDYILNELCKLSKQAFPFYVDWNMIGAFNGAVLSMPFRASQANPEYPSSYEADAAQVLFYQQELDLSNSGSSVATIGDMKVSIYPANDPVLGIDSSQIQKISENAEIEFNNQFEKEEVLNQIARLHFRIQTKGFLDESANKQCNEFMLHIASTVSGFIRLPPTYEEWLSPNADQEIQEMLNQNYDQELEILFDFRIRESEVLEKLSNVIPEIKSNLRGYGQIISDSNSDVLRKWNISFLHIFARYF